MTKELKPFDLEAARNGDPICTTDGNRVFFVGIEQTGHVVYQRENCSGLFTNSTKHMRMLPKKVVRWVNFSKMGKLGDLDNLAWHYDTEEQAKADAEKYYNTLWIAIAVPVEIEQ